MSDDCVTCPECERLGLRSTVTEGMLCVTTVYCPPFHDELGHRHVHDVNASTTHYACSQGHAFTRSRHGSCWCGWTSRPGDRA